MKQQYLSRKKKYDNLKRILSFFMRKIHYLFLILFILILLISNIYWLKLDTAPPMWDQSWYLENSASFYHALTTVGPMNFLFYFSRAFSTKAPLISALPIPFYYLLGISHDTALIVNLVFVVLLNVFLFLLIKNIGSLKTAFLTIFITGTMPLVVGLSREFLVEYGLLTFIVIWMYLLIKSNLLKNKSSDLLLGFVLGLGMLMKGGFAVVALIPFLVVLGARIKNDLISNPSENDWIKFVGEKILFLLIDLLIILIPGILIASSWYWRNGKNIINFAKSAGFGDLSKDYASPLLEYWLQVINIGVSSYYFFLLIAMLVVFVIVKVKNRNLQLNWPQLKTWVLLSWFLVPFIVYSSSINKDIRFMIAILPVIAYLIAFLYVNIFKEKFFYIFLPILFVFPAISIAYASFDFLGEKSLSCCGFTFISPQLSYLHRPIDEQWPIEDILQFIYENNGGRDTSVITLSDHHFFNISNLLYYKILRFHPIDLSTTAYIQKKNLNELLEKINQYQYIISKTGYQGPEFTTIHNSEILDMIQNNQLNYQLIQQYDLPDGSQANIYKKP